MREKIKKAVLVISGTMIILALVAIGIVGYFVIQQYNIFQKKTGSEKSIKEQQALNNEIQELQQEVENLKNQQTKTQVNNSPVKTIQSGNISAADIQPYLTGVYQVVCNNVEGSGSLWNIGGAYSVLTNHHVITSPNPDGRCDVEFFDSKNGNSLTNLYAVYPQQSDKVWNNSTDVALLKLFSETLYHLPFSIPAISGLNYKISFLPRCQNNLAIGSPVVVLGYPAFGMTQFNYQGSSGLQATLITTNGVISGYDSSNQQPIGKLPYPNYFVSAVIDSGNSGGIAISKTFKGLCVLGIPTWISLGNYQTQGIIQNINNVMYTGS